MSLEAWGDEIPDSVPEDCVTEERAQEMVDEATAVLKAEVERLKALINTPHNDNFLEGVRIEAAHQREKWGEAHDRGKSAEHWYWLVGYLAGKALRATIDGKQDKALHHTISSAAALLHWHDVISRDYRQWPFAGVGKDEDLQRNVDPLVML